MAQGQFGQMALQSSMSEKFGNALEASAWMDPDKEGYLSKRGHIVKNWKKRWFRLKKDTLFYFKEKDGLPKGEIKLRGYTVEQDRTSGRDYCFALKGGKDFIVQASSKSDMDEWMAAITRCLAGGGSTTPTTAVAVSPPTVSRSPSVRNLPPLDSLEGTPTKRATEAPVDPLSFFKRPDGAEWGPNKKCFATDARDGRKVWMVRREFKSTPARQAAADLMQLKAVSHPNLIPLVEVGTIGLREVVVVSAFEEGCSLFDVLELFGTIQMSEAQMALVCREVLRALSQLHSMRLVHRDVKSEKVILGSGGSVRLTGYEFAMSISENGEPKSAVVAGSPYWIAPEVIRTECYTSRSDIWSLGVLLLEMVQGAPPYIEMTPLHALHEVISKGLPVLEPQPPRVSNEAVSFFVACAAPLESRPDTEALQAHEFLKAACAQDEIAALVKQVAASRGGSQQAVGK